MSRIAVPLALLLLAGCSCCNSPFQVRTYAIDDATAMRSGPSGCVDLCNTLGFGLADANVPVADASPVIVRASGCALDHGAMEWTLTCYYGMGCPR
jgi:hypothetical protein